MSAPRNAVVWIEIPVTDMSRAKAFYSAVLEQELTEQDGGPNPIAVFTCDGEGVSGHLYPGTPAVGGQGSTVHLAAPGELAATMKRVNDAGGSVVGYPMRSGFDLPPLMFDREETVALVLGARLVAAWGGTGMAVGARSALSKIETVLPHAGIARDALARLGAPPVGLCLQERERIDRIESLKVAEERFEASAERSVATFIAQVAERDGRKLPPDPFA